MFTGIIEEVGAVTAAGPRLLVACRTVLVDSDTGASVSVGGVCLTVVDRRAGADGEGTLAFDLSPETRDRSTLGDLDTGDRVNLERPVTLLQRLGGHLVQGHVDGVGTVASTRQVDTGMEATIAFPAELGRYLVEKGSVAVEGVSLTVTVVESDTFGVALIPHTLEATTLGAWEPGARVNLEVDVVAKYVERLVGRSA
jgi:riboflavin synthase